MVQVVNKARICLHCRLRHVGIVENGRWPSFAEVYVLNCSACSDVGALRRPVKV